jgi:hypothetical protein
MTFRRTTNHTYLFVKTRLVAAIAACCAVWLAPQVRAAEPPDSAGQAIVSDAGPLLEQFCVTCHDAETKKGDLELPAALTGQHFAQNPALWRTVLRQLEERAMPPPGKKQPSEDERERLTAAVRRGLAENTPAVRDPGRVTLRRLNRAEYNNTVRDLLGVDAKPADAFPADGAGGGGFDNNADTLFVPAVLMEQYLRAATDVLDKADPARLFTVRPADGVAERKAARLNVERFATRAFRRPAGDEEVDRYLALYDAAAARGSAFEPAVKLALRAVLVSPAFLFRIEEDRPAGEPYEVGQYELASRLSYFLWSSMPDDELMRLAAEGRLHDPAVLDQQARRMLADPKSRAMAESFAAQWLGVRSLEAVVRPDKRKFPEYTPALRDAMVQEAVLLVDSVFRDDASLLRLVDADYTFVNEDLARLYGIPNVSGPEMRRVALTDPNRGGILSLAGVLTATSYPRRTSPVLRGRWVLDDLLGVPPPPPPPDVLQLPEDAKGDDGKPLTLRQRVERHRADPSCASCHARMDPIGFGLENFDAIGRWRDTDEGAPVDSAGVLVSGESFNGPAELKRVIATAKRDPFVRHLTEKLLAYALGRGIEYYDEAAVTRVTDALATSDYRSGVLVAEIVKSFPFRYRRNDASMAGPADEGDGKAGEP